MRLSGLNLAKIILGSAVIPGGAFLTLATDNLDTQLAGCVICWLGGGAVMLLAIAANRTADLIQHNAESIRSDGSATSPEGKPS